CRRAPLAFRIRVSPNRSAPWPTRSSAESRRRATVCRLRMVHAWLAWPKLRTGRGAALGFVRGRLGVGMITPPSRGEVACRLRPRFADSLIREVEFASIGEDDFGAGVARSRIGHWLSVLGRAQNNSDLVARLKRASRPARARQEAWTVGFDAPFDDFAGA